MRRTKNNLTSRKQLIPTRIVWIRKIIYKAFILILLIFLGYKGYKTLCHKDLWPVSRLILIGDIKRTTRKEVLLILQQQSHLNNILTQNVRLVQQHLQRLPWISEANVRKQWPNLLRITLQEYNPIAVWKQQQLLDENGKLFSAPIDDGLKQELPHFFGPYGSEQLLLKYWKDMTAMLSKHTLKITNITLSSHYSWRLTINDRIRVILGHEQVIERLQRFLLLYPLWLLEEQKGNLARVDLRYPSGAAVTWSALPHTLIADCR